MIKTPNNLHLFLSIGECLPLSYFNPPKDCDCIVAFKPHDLNFQNTTKNSDQYHFRRKMGGWVLEDIVEGGYN